MLVEVNQDALRDAGSSSVELLSRIADLGLEPYLVDEERAALVPAPEPLDLPIYNLLCR